MHYDETWLDSPLGRPLSLSLPLRPASAPYKGELVGNYFENLLPDNDNVRQRLAKRFSTGTKAFRRTGGRTPGRHADRARLLAGRRQFPDFDQLNGSSQAAIDRRDFFRTQVLFWMLAAIDGHAKNFSVFIEARGFYRLTPRYDVLSAHPVMGHGAGRLAAHQLKMAMAVNGKNRHYKWSEIRRQHFAQTAQDCRLPDAPALIDEPVASPPPPTPLPRWLTICRPVSPPTWPARYSMD